MELYFEQFYMPETKNKIGSVVKFVGIIKKEVYCEKLIINLKVSDGKVKLKSDRRFIHVKDPNHSFRLFQKYHQV